MGEKEGAGLPPYGSPRRLGTLYLGTLYLGTLHLGTLHLGALYLRTLLSATAR